MFLPKIKLWRKTRTKKEEAKTHLSIHLGLSSVVLGNAFKVASLRVGDRILGFSELPWEEDRACASWKDGPED